MSKFFNETRGAQSAAPAPVASNGSNVDIQAMVGALKQTLAEASSPAGHAESNLKQLLKPLNGHDIAAQMHSGRLEKCRSIRLPRTEEKSFLVSEYDPAMQAAVEAYRTLRTRLVKQQSRNGARSLVVSSALQGDGKTLTAFNLALCYASIQNWPVLLVDADLRTRGLSGLMGDPESAGLAGILEGTEDYPSAVLRTDVPGLCVLPAGETKSSPPELLSGTSWKEFMGWASETFRLVIVDSPPALDLSDFELITSACESVLLVVRAHQTLRESLTRVLAQVDSKKLTGVVFNAAEEPSHKNYYQYAASARAAG